MVNPESLHILFKVQCLPCSAFYLKAGTFVAILPPYYASFILERSLPLARINIIVSFQEPQAASFQDGFQISTTTTEVDASAAFPSFSASESPGSFHRASLLFHAQAFTLHSRLRSLQPYSVLYFNHVNNNNNNFNSVIIIMIILCANINNNRNHTNSLPYL